MFKVQKQFKIFSSYTTRYFHGSSVHRFPITSVNIETDKKLVHVAFTGGVLESFPWHFLQDNCTCTECFDSASQSRKKRMTTLDLAKKVSTVEVITTDKPSIKIHWDDGHEGIFSESWLLDRSFSKVNQEKRKLGFRDRIQLVGSDYKITRFSFQQVLDDETKLLDCLVDLCKFGVVLLTDAPKAIGQLRKIADKIGFIRTTHYGNEFTVRSIPKAVNLAYTSKTLTVHTDLPYYAYPPGVQMLHCIKQQEGVNIGGESHLVDGFMVAEYMKNSLGDLKEQFANLCDTVVEFYDVGQDYTKFHKVHHSPTFVKCPVTGNLTRIVYSNQQLSSYLPIDLDMAQPLYQALKTFTSLCYDEKFLMQFKLKEGDIMVFDNWRFLHGRTEFDPTKGERHLEGCYVDWDEIFSRIRVLTP